MTELHLYLKNGIYCYMVEGGEMSCPSFVRGREAARRFFGPDYLLHFMGEEQLQERKASRAMEWPRIAPESEAEPEKVSRPRRERRTGGGMGRPRVAIAQYGLDGTFIRVWPDRKDAASTLGCSCSSLSKCCHGETKSAGGYMWRLVGRGGYPKSLDGYTVKRRLNSNRAKKVVCRDMTGKIVAEYRSTVEAGRAVGMSARMIRYYCKEKSKAYNGLKWEYL